MHGLMREGRREPVLYTTLLIDLERGMMVSNCGGKMGDGVDRFGKWCNVGLHKLSANLRVAQACFSLGLLPC
jgi:hypothetical protein